MPPRRRPALLFPFCLVFALSAHASGGAIERYPLPRTTVPAFDYLAAAGDHIWAAVSRASSVAKISNEGVLLDVFPLPSMPVDALAGDPADGGVWVVSGGRFRKIAADGTPGPIVHVPPLGSWVRDAVLGPDGNLWIGGSQTVYRVTPQGQIREFPVGFSIESLASGFDDSVWVLSSSSTDHKVGRLTTEGMFTVTQITDAVPNSDIFYGLAAAADGTAWIAGNGGKIREIDPGGGFTTYAASGYNYFPRMTSSPDGAVWVSGRNFVPTSSSQLGLVNPVTGAVTSFPLPRLDFISTIEGGMAGIWYSNRESPSLGLLKYTGEASEFRLPTVAAIPGAIAVAADGTAWVTEPDANQIARRNPDGSFVEYPLPILGSRPTDIVIGPDGAAWFTEEGSDRIGRFDVSGALTEYLVPTLYSKPRGITVGPDGNIWFTMADADKIGRLDVSTFEITEFPLPGIDREPHSIVTGADGALWFTETQRRMIGRMSLDGMVVEYPMPGSATPGGPGPLVNAPDGNLYVLDRGKVVRFTHAGVGTALPVTIPGFDIAVGADSALWITENCCSVVRYVPGESLFRPMLPVAGQPWGIAAGPDGSVWYTDQADRSINRIQLDRPIVASGRDLCFSPTNSFAGVVATFTDTDPVPGPAEAYSAIIDWGDTSTLEAGEIVALGGGSFEVRGSHTTWMSGSQPVATVTIQGTPAGEIVAGVASVESPIRLGDIALSVPERTYDGIPALVGIERLPIGATVDWSISGAEIVETFSAAVRFIPRVGPSLSLTAVVRNGACTREFTASIPVWDRFGDLGGDGQADLLWRHPVTGLLVVWNVVDGVVVSSRDIGPVDPAWTVAGIADFNLDGEADLLWKHSSGALTIWLMAGGSPATGWDLPALDSNEQVIAIDDFTGSLHPDVLVRNPLTGTITVWQMSGGLRESASHFLDVSPAYDLAGMGDFDANGERDFLWRHAESGYLVVWFREAGTLTNVDVGTASTAYHVGAVADYDADGKADIVWRNPASGENVIWLMDGHLVRSGLLLPGAPAPWTIVGPGRGE